MSIVEDGDLRFAWVFSLAFSGAEFRFWCDFIEVRSSLVFSLGRKRLFLLHVEKDEEGPSLAPSDFSRHPESSCQGNEEKLVSDCNLHHGIHTIVTEDW